jgi:cell wall-associated NlpC family hydrolase
VTSYRLKRSLGRALVASAILAVSIATIPASADPQPPANASDALKQYQDIAHQAEVVAEQYHQAQDAHTARKADLARANADQGRAEQAVQRAHAQEEQYRGQVDMLTHASYEGARMNKLSALLVSTTPNEFLDRASTLEALSRDDARIVRALSDATAQATAGEKQAQDARNRAAAAEADAARIEADVAQKKAAMDAQANTVRQQYLKLSAGDRSILSSRTSVSLLGGSGAAIAAVNAALSKQGDPYVWGATGPRQFDCSGLVQWAFEQVGISLPRSSQAQARAGVAVSASDLKPGDLIAFYSDASHIGIYIGNGNVVHAPTEGENVKVTPYKYIGSVYSMRRVAG